MAPLTNCESVIEGTAERVADQAELQAVADKYVAEGWPASAG